MNSLKHTVRYLDLTNVGNRLTFDAFGSAPQARAEIDVSGSARLTLHLRALNGATWSTGTATAKGGLITEDLRALAVPQQITASARLARAIDVSGDGVVDLVVDTAESGIILEVHAFTYDPPA